MATFNSTSPKYPNFMDELNKVTVTPRPTPSRNPNNVVVITGSGGGGGSSWGSPTYDLLGYADYTGPSNDKTLTTLKNLYNNAGAGYTVKPIDLTPVINAKTASAQAQKDALTTSYESNRQTLLDSIKRFQRQTEENRDAQREAYLLQRGDLENAAFMADRQSRISAASKGLSGSGLQQLAQLGNILSQSSEINKAARANQKAQDDLTTKLNDAQAQSDRELINLENTHAGNITNIDRSLEEAISQLILNEEIRQENARQEAARATASQRASLAAQMAERENTLKSDYDDGIAILTGLQNSLDNDLKTLTNNGKNTGKEEKKKAKELVNSYINLLDNSQDGLAGQGYVAQFRLGQNNRNIAVSNYDTLLKKYNLN